MKNNFSLPGVLGVVQTSIKAFIDLRLGAELIFPI